MLAWCRDAVAPMKWLPIRDVDAGRECAATTLWWSQCTPGGKSVLKKKKEQVELHKYGVHRGFPGCTVVVPTGECRTRMEGLMRGDARVEGAQTAFRRLRRRWKTEYQLFPTGNEICECDTPDNRVELAEKASSSHELKKIRMMTNEDRCEEQKTPELEDHNVALDEIVQMQLFTFGA